MVDYSQEDEAGACPEPHTFSVGDAWKDTSFPYSPALCLPEQILPQPPRFTSFLISPCPPLYSSHFKYGCCAAALVPVGQPWLLLKIKQWPAEQQAEGAAGPTCLLSPGDSLPGTLQGEGGPWSYGSSISPVIKVLVCSCGTVSLRL